METNQRKIGRPKKPARTGPLVLGIEGSRTPNPVARAAALFASILVSGGTPLRVVQKWLGHSSITTSERYGHLAPGAGDEYIGLLSFRGETDADLIL